MEEVWIDIPSVEGRYQVSNLGKVRSLWFRNNQVSKLRREPRLCKLSRHNQGFLTASVAGFGSNAKSKPLVHNLVLLAFVGEKPAGHTAFHKNGIKTDNRLENLEYRDASRPSSITMEGQPSPDDLPGEIWRFIPGYETLYEASSMGRIRSLWFRNNKVSQPRHKPLIMKDTTAGIGYRQVPIWTNGKQKFFLVHRLVMAAFHGWREWRGGNESTLVNHKNGNKADNRLDNLEYCTPSENNQHAIMTGLRNPSMSATKLIYTDISVIRNDNRPLREIASDYGVCEQTISNVKRRKTWKSIP